MGMLPGIYGASWWLPLPQGGKDLGAQGVKDFMGHVSINNPAKSILESYWDPWGLDTLRGLQGLDLDGDRQLSVVEFYTYLASITVFKVHHETLVEEGVHCRWLLQTMERDPCLIVNALVHLNHTLTWFSLREDGMDVSRNVPWSAPQYYIGSYSPGSTVPQESRVGRMPEAGDPRCQSEVERGWAQVKESVPSRECEL